MATTPALDRPSSPQRVANRAFGWSPATASVQPQVWHDAGAATLGTVRDWREILAELAANPQPARVPLVTRALECLVAEKGVTDTGSLARYRDAWDHAADRTPHGQPIELQPEDFR